MTTLEPRTPTTPANKRHSLGPRPLHLLDGSIVSPTAFRGPLTAPLFPSIPGAGVAYLPSPLTPSPSTRPRPANLRRQSSIGYSRAEGEPLFSPSPLSPAASKANRRASVQIGVRDTQALNARLSAGDILDRRRSAGSSSSLSKDEVSTTESNVEEGRTPLTLAEKHADLLHFIAQKESKCLELRTQLAQHEAELAQLKRKWERIVSRGNPLSSSPSSASSPNASSLSLSSSGGASIGANAATTALQHGKRMSVTAAHEVGKRLAGMGKGIGLSDFGLALPLPVSSVGFGAGGASTTSSSSAYPSPPSSLHAAKPSIASVASISTACTRSSSDSTRLSQSSVASSLGFLDSPIESLKEGEDEEGGEEEQTVVMDGSSSSNVKQSDVKSLRRRSRETTLPLSPSPSPSRTASPGPLSPTPTDRTSTSAPPRTSSAITPKDQPSMRGPLRPKLKPKSGSSISGSMTPAGWVGSVGKRWDDLQKSDAFTKSSKRASLLLSDVFTALTAPSSPIPPNVNFANLDASKSQSQSLLDFDSPSLPATASASAFNKSAPAPISLLDGDIDDDVAAAGTLMMPSPAPSKSSSPSLTPSPLYATATSSASKAASDTGADAFDNDWNW